MELVLLLVLGELQLLVGLMEMGFDLPQILLAAALLACVNLLAWLVV
jgi:hypothetical protein